MLPGDGGFQNALAGAAGGAGSFGDILLRGGGVNWPRRIHWYRNDRWLIRISTAGTSVWNVSGMLTDFHIVVPQLCHDTVPVTVAAGAGVKRIPILFTGRSYLCDNIVVNQNGFIGFGGDGFLRPQAV